MRSFKSIAIAAAVAVFLIIGAALPAAADTMFSLKGGAVGLENNGYNNRHYGEMYGFAFSYLPPIQDRWLEFNFEYLHGHSSQYIGCGEGVTCVSGSFGTVNFTRSFKFDAFSFGAHYRPPLSATIQPYIGGGIGMYIFNIEERGFFITPGDPPAPLTTSSRDQIRQGFHFDLGVDFRLTAHWLAGLEFKYVSIRPSDAPSAAPDWQRDLSFEGIFGHVRYAF